MRISAWPMRSELTTAPMVVRLRCSAIGPSSPASVDCDRAELALGRDLGVADRERPTATRPGEPTGRPSPTARPSEPGRTGDRTGDRTGGWGRDDSPPVPPPRRPALALVRPTDCRLTPGDADAGAGALPARATDGRRRPRSVELLGLDLDEPATGRDRGRFEALLGEDRPRPGRA
mgnify:CR=1 FL=1